MKSVRGLFFSILILAAPSVWAIGGDSDIFDRPERSPARDVVIYSDMFPKKFDKKAQQDANLQCEAVCADRRGALYSCAEQFETYESCSGEAGEDQSCVWSCN